MFNMLRYLNNGSRAFVPFLTAPVQPDTLDESDMERWEDDGGAC